MRKTLFLVAAFAWLLNAREISFWVGPGQALDFDAAGAHVYPFRDVNGHGALYPLSDGQVVRIRWQPAEGETPRETRLPWQRDVGLPLCRVLPSGDLAVADMGGRLRILDGNGAPLRETGLQAGGDAYRYNSENMVLLRVARNGRLLAALWLAAEKKVILTLYNAALEVLRREVYSGVYLRQIGLAPDGRNLGVALYTAEPFIFDTRVLDDRGEVLVRSAQRTRAFIFDGNGRVALQDKKRLEVYDMNNGRLKGAYRTEQLISAVVFEASGRLVVETARVSRHRQPGRPAWYYGNLRLHWLDASLRLQKKENLEGGSYYPSLIYDRKGERVWIGLESKQAVREVRR